MRTTVTLAALLLTAVLAAPAQARLVYVKRPASVQPVVYVASDTGKNPRRVGVGRAPTISPDGRWVAFITVPGEQGGHDAVVLQRLRSGSQRLVMRARTIDSLRFAPDSRRLAAIQDDARVRVYDIARDRLRTAASGDIRGYSFSPDSARIVYGEAAGDDFQARSDLYTAALAGPPRPTRLTTTRDAVYPVWGPQEVFYDRFKRRKGDAPAFNLFAVNPADKEMRRLTDLTIPRLVSGLVPLEVSSDGKRMLAVFTGQDTQVGFTVLTAGGRTRALSRDFEQGLVGFDLSADGRTILAHTGGPDPANAHDVVTVGWGASRARTLVEDAAYPDWSR